MTETYKLIEKLLEVAECYSDGRETYEPFEQIIREARSYLNNEKSVMTEQNPITPPPELVQQWFDTATENDGQSSEGWPLRLANYAAQWGADQELEACCEWLAHNNYPLVVVNIGQLRAARRPKPPSLKQQALEAFERFTSGENGIADDMRDGGIIRRALEALPE